MISMSMACHKPLMHAKAATDVYDVEQRYETGPNTIYYAVRWALETNDYSVAEEDLRAGLIRTAWLPTTADSHYVPIFGRKDYGVTNSYYQLKIKVLPEGTHTRVLVTSHAKTVVSTLKSSGIEEGKILASMAHYLRSKEPNITNLGIEK